MNKPVFQNVHISTIRVGDVVKHDNKVLTVSGKNIKRDDFMGHTLFGDSYALGNKPVTKVVEWL